MVQVNNSNAAVSLAFTNNNTTQNDHIASGKDPVTNAKVVQTESKGVFASILQTLKDSFNSFMSFLGFSDKPISERKVSLLPTQTDKGEPTVSRLMKQSDGLASKAEAFLKKSKNVANRAKGSEGHGEAMNAVSDTAKEALKSKSMSKSTHGKSSLLKETANDFQKATARFNEQMQQKKEAYDNSALGKFDNFLSKLFS